LEINCLNINNKSNFATDAVEIYLKGIFFKNPKPPIPMEKAYHTFRVQCLALNSFNFISNSFKDACKILISVSILLFTVSTSFAQQPVGSATVKANFGVDADVYANRLQFSPLAGFPPYAVPATGTDDFFQNLSTDPGTGRGVVGISAATVDPGHWNKISAAQYKSTYCQSNNIAMRNKTYVQRMSEPFGYLDLVKGVVWLDAIGARDNFSSGNQNDSSVFAGTSNKNGDNPMTWNVGIGGTPQKNDLIDIAAHIRYDITTASPQNPNGDLWGFAYATTLSADGNSHTDFEIYRAPVEYSPLTGFTNLQVVIPQGMNNYLDSMGFEGGHTAGLHALDGTTLRPGDL
jgi:hypothetical protein